ncbi:NirD/YgiW/YdeI family stress tolerance protein [Citrobacter rodentium]|jgi:Uncharacterized conserved protein|uniref:Exported protein n=2 Tax=Citrobacter rodentium TaxID=67825 RepID=D2TIH0_CITRI|nr:NirD/YgiW/YdeI family stress tolerance protein [Citrobacter rodentium]KIQ51316.1 hypothetical protein TA05_10915 [Citrobacter rodentium]QBY28125.1 NirD/YgiW/YdeI family stress tolerance protein [Citrobacter rodentium]UHO29997.1 NirD/YgiW/YdeI family stress tolerance protein [Citrobacter rodentium NBRC 105723 = DSM 16636]CBG88297.1 putative exported protein [Citrobacter rodentium ICC168]HAT8011502.1 hypothetical protein [Citrobacter rodentium NBRC 105723 = DSM 16636]
MNVLKKTILLLAISTFCSGVMANEHSVSTTVAQVKKMPDDTRVTLEGRITGRAGDDDDEFWFADRTGRIRINIDDEDDYGRLSGKSVRITGDVDRDDRHTEIDVDYLKILN